MLQIGTSGPNTYLICPEYRLTSRDKITQERFWSDGMGIMGGSQPGLVLLQQRKEFQFRKFHSKKYLTNFTFLL